MRRLGVAAGSVKQELSFPSITSRNAIKMKHIESWFRLSSPALVFAVSGCFQPGTGFEPNMPVDYSKLVPASGIVTVHGKPLANAVVMLMNSTGIPMVGETGEDGRFELETGSKKGALPGKYQVT